MSELRRTTLPPSVAGVPRAGLPPRPRLRWFSTHHRVIGVQYLLLSLAAVGIGTVLSLLMRVHLVWPALRLPLLGILQPEGYLALVTMHGTLMVFFVLTVAPFSGFANLVLPEQIGANGMAFPRLNAAGFWLTVSALLILLAAFLVPGGAPISGWSSYPPLSALAVAGSGQALGMDLWLVSLALFCAGAWLGAVCLLVTVLYERCPGMRLMRMPLTAWSWFVSAVLVLLAFSVLLAALVMLLCDRHAGTSFFVPLGEVVNGVALPRGGDGSPLLWLHLFWFFGHPEVYIAILPGMGLASSLLANFTRRPVLGYRFMVSTTLAIGGLGLLVWGHHMFVSGMNPYAGSAFALTTMAIALPSAGKVFSWLGTLLGTPGDRGLPQPLTRTPVPMLFALGFVSLFIAGGLTGRVLGERLGRWHFWLTFVGAYATFFPMHFAGLAGQPRHYAQLAGTTSALANLLPLQRGITYAALCLSAAQLLFLVNLVRSLRSGVPAGANPWRATTLEWAPPVWLALAPAERKVLHGPYDYGVPASAHEAQADFKMQCDSPAQPE